MVYIWRWIILSWNYRPQCNLYTRYFGYRKRISNIDMDDRSVPMFYSKCKYDLDDQSSSCANDNRRYRIL